jgi:hypothetical protein
VLRRESEHLNKSLLSRADREVSLSNVDISLSGTGWSSSGVTFGTLLFRKRLDD